MSKQNSVDLPATLIQRLQALGKETAAAIKAADAATAPAREHLREALKGGDFQQPGAAKVYQSATITALSGQPVKDGPWSGKDNVLTEAQQDAYVRVRKWLQRERAALGITPTTKDGEAKKSGKRGAQTPKGPKDGKETRAPTPQAAIDALQVACLKLEGRNKTAALKSLRNVADKLGAKLKDVK